jgi:threonine aldolase
MNIIDLHSDTVTRPTTEMRKAMASAIVGDDVSREDPTIILLENRVAKMFNKEAALFFPSGTMSNLTALLTWCSTRGSEFIVGDKSHMFLFEQAGAAQFGGISPRTVPNLHDGTMDLNMVCSAIRDDDIHEPITKLICIENTHNACGGKVLSDSFMKDLKDLSDKYNIPIHLDGARIWNALSATDVNPYKIGNYVSSLSVCLSKGLGAPIGSLLVGESNFIEKSRRIRKALGGGMRQVGILGAAGLKALDDFESGILIHDHIRTLKLADGLKNVFFLNIRENIQSNIIFADIVSKDKSINSQTISTMLKEKGVCVSAWEPMLIRLVVHRDINNEDIEKTINSFQEINNTLKGNEFN